MVTDPEVVRLLRPVLTTSRMIHLQIRDLLDQNAAVAPSSAVGRPRAGTDSSGKVDLLI